MSFKDLAITSLDTITGYDPTTKLHLFTLDELSNATISQTQEKQDIVGKLGRKLSSFKKNKAVNISATNGLVSEGLLEMQTGSKFASRADLEDWDGKVTVRVHEELTAKEISTTGSVYVRAGGYKSGLTYYTKSGSTYSEASTAPTAETNFSTTELYLLDTDLSKISISHVAEGTTGSEIVDLYTVNDDNTLGTRLSQGIGVSPKSFYYDKTNSVIYFLDSVVEDDDLVVVHYDYKTDGDELKSLSDTYSGKCLLLVDCTAEDACLKQYRVQFRIPKADVNGEFSLEMGDNQTVHAFEAEALAGGCGGKSEFFSYIVFGVSDSDGE